MRASLKHALRHARVRGLTPSIRTRQDSILQLGVPQGKVMDLVEMVTEIKEALSLEASSSALR